MKNLNIITKVVVAVVILGAAAALYIFTPMASQSSALVAKSVTEPFHLVRVLFLEIIPANLLMVAGLAFLLCDSFLLARRAPHAGSRLFEQTKMTIISAVLFAQYTKLSGLASTLSNATTGAILGAFGAASLGFAAVFIITLRRYLAERSRIIQEIENGSGQRQQAASLGQRSPWSRPLAAGGTLAALVLVGLFLARLDFAIASPATEPPKQEAAKPEKTGPSEARTTAPVPRSVSYNQEVVERMTVGSQAKRGDDAAGTSGDASLPDGLRFSWQGGGLGWEPAFIKRTRDGAYWWRGQRIPANSAILKAFALEGPAVRPDSSDGYLFFHKDVLGRLHDQFTGRASDESQPNVSVDRQGTDVVLRIAGNSTRPAQTIIVSAKL